MNMYWLFMEKDASLLITMPWISCRGEHSNVHKGSNGGKDRENLCQVGYRVHKLRSGLGRVYPGLENSPIFSALFKGICQVVANRLIGQQFSELWHIEHLANKRNGKVKWIIKYPWDEDLGTQSDGVSRVEFCIPITWRVRVWCSFHP